MLVPQVLSLMVKWMRRGSRGQTSRRQGEHLTPLVADEVFLSTNKIFPATKGIAPRVRYMARIEQWVRHACTCSCLHASVHACECVSECVCAYACACQCTCERACVCGLCMHDEL